MNRKNLKGIAHDLLGYLLKIRNEIHLKPCTRWEEDPTISILKREIASFGNPPEGVRVDIRDMCVGGFVVAIIVQPENPEFEYLFRADLDAVPCQEDPSMPVVSEVPGKAHTCGHDFNTAGLLVFLGMVMEGQVKPIHNILLVWSRAEENPDMGPVVGSGCAKLVEEGVTNNVRKAIAVHPWIFEEPGVWQMCEGPMLGNSDRFQIQVAGNEQVSGVFPIALHILAMLQGIGDRLLGPETPNAIIPTILEGGCTGGQNNLAARLKISIKGASGGHVSMPNKGQSVIDVFTQFLLWLHAFNNAPTPFYVAAGNSGNVLPASGELWLGLYSIPAGVDKDEAVESSLAAMEQVVMRIAQVYAPGAEVAVTRESKGPDVDCNSILIKGGARSYLEQKEQAEFHRELERRVVATGGLYGANVSYTPLKGHETTSNTPDVVKDVRGMLVRNGEVVKPFIPLLGGEDFGRLVDACSKGGAMFMLGVKTEGSGNHHSPKFNPDLNELWRIPYFWALLAGGDPEPYMDLM